MRFTQVGGEHEPYSSAREASGLLQLVALLTAIYDDEVGVLLIDEPEVSLYPQLQAFLLREMHRVAGDPEEEKKKLIVIATHSTEMVDLRKASDLPSLVFCYDVTENPKQISADAGELRSRKVKSLIARMSQEHKLTFFCQRPILLEGPSDEIVASGLSRIFNLYLEAAGAQPLPVIGKGQMPVVTKLMRLIGKSPVVIADADAVADGLDLIGAYAGEPTVNVEAQAHGFPNISRFARSIHSDFCQLSTTIGWISKM